jgi:hypothetical protein
MKKHNFENIVSSSLNNGISTLLGEAPQKVKLEKRKETRATFVITEEILQELKDLAYWERKTQKELLEEALLDLFNKYPKKEERK